MQGEFHEGMGFVYILILTDGSTITTCYDDLFDIYNPFDPTIGKNGDYKIPQKDWKVDLIIGQEWK